MDFTIGSRHIAEADYDKPNRCPGWSGAGWRYNKVNWCSDVLPEGVRRWPTGSIFERKLWFLRVARTNCCGTYVLPHALIWLNFWTWRHGTGWRMLRQKFTFLRWYYLPKLFGKRR